MSKKEDTRTEQEKRVAAHNTVAEFFQFKYFYYLILKIKEDEEIGYEVKEDIHIKYTLTKNTNLIQIKHTILTDKDGEPKNLTEKDPALWKTISNWVKMVNDKNDNGRDDYNKQIEFIKKTDFTLVSNKQSAKNKFFVKIQEYQKKIIDIQTIKKYLSNINVQLDLFGNPVTVKKGKKSQTDKDVELLLSQTDEWLGLFFSKISIEQIDNIGEKVLERFTEMWGKIYTKNTKNVYQCFLDELINIASDKANKKEPILITQSLYLELIGKCGNHFLSTPNLVTTTFDYKIPPDIALHPEKQLFIEQLLNLEIPAINMENKSKMLEYTSNKFAAKNSLKRWEHDYIVLDAAKQIEKNSKRKWGKAFDETYNRPAIKVLKELSDNNREEKLKDLGEKCFNKTLSGSPIKINNYSLDDTVSDGHFFLLSDIPEIGWHLYWKKLHKKTKKDD